MYPKDGYVIHYTWRDICDSLTYPFIANIDIYKKKDPVKDYVSKEYGGDKDKDKDIISKCKTYKEVQNCDYFD